VCDKVYRFRALEEFATPEFIELALNAPSMVLALDSAKTGISDSGVNLTQKKFLSLLLLVPPLPEQREVVARVRPLIEISERRED